MCIIQIIQYPKMTFVGVLLNVDLSVLSIHSFGISPAEVHFMSIQYTLHEIGCSGSK